jgi:hypothetical protein
MPGLAIHTEAGQAHEVHNRKCWQEIMKYLRGGKVQLTHDSHPADGIVRHANDNKPVLLVEVKSRRDFNEEYFWTGHHGEWLITNRKILHAAQIAKDLNVPFAGALHIIQSKVVLLKVIANNGKIIPYRVLRTQTQETINGGRIVRENAFIPMDGAKRLTYDT